MTPDEQTISVPAGESPVRIRHALAEALSRPAGQQPDWPDPEAAREVRQLLEVAPPLVSPVEVRALHRRLCSVAAGKAFVLQGGDCAETFATSTQQHVACTAGLLGDMAEVLAGSGKPVVKIGRIAGQFAKPPIETGRRVGVAGLPR